MNGFYVGWMDRSSRWADYVSKFSTDENLLFSNVFWFVFTSHHTEFFCPSADLSQYNVLITTQKPQANAVTVFSHVDTEHKNKKIFKMLTYVCVRKWVAACDLSAVTTWTNMLSRFFWDYNSFHVVSWNSERDGRHSRGPWINNH